MKINRNDYDNVRLSTERLKAGGHRCIIKQVNEGKSSTGKDMLTISFDTTEEDIQPKFFTNDYLAQESNKKWHGSYYMVNNDYFLKTLKQLNGAIKSTNEAFEGVSDEGLIITDAYKGQKVGIVFREEEFMANTGRKATSVKPFYFCSYDDAPEREIPAKKALPDTAQAFTPSADPMSANEGFMAVPDNLEDEGLPFA